MVNFEWISDSLSEAGLRGKRESERQSTCNLYESVIEPAFVIPRICRARADQFCLLAHERQTFLNTESWFSHVLFDNFRVDSEAKPRFIVVHPRMSRRSRDCLLFKAQAIFDDAVGDENTIQLQVTVAQSVSVLPFLWLNKSIDTPLFIVSKNVKLKIMTDDEYFYFWQIWR